MMSTNIPSRKNWFRDGEISNDLQYDALVDYYMSFMLNHTFVMFEYENLPDGLNSYDLEKFTQLQGYSLLVKKNNKNYCVQCTPSDYITFNYEPRKALVANPAVPELNGEYVLNEDAVLLRNDLLRDGLYPLMKNNACLMASVDLSIEYASFNSRFKKVFVSNDDNVTDSINKLIADIWYGKKPVSVATDSIIPNKKDLDSISYNESVTSDIKDLIELKQYLKANWYIDLGVNANYNMKREAVSENESKMNDDALLPFIDNMLRCRKEDIASYNKISGNNISVKLSSAWQKIRDEIVIEKKQEEALLTDIENKTENVKGGGNDADGKTE